MGSFLVIGMGRFGRSVAMELYHMKHEVLVVEEQEELIADMVNHATDVIIGDSKDETVLRSLGVPNFDCVIVAIASDIESSVLTTIMLKDLGAKMLICKARNVLHSKILTQLGADRVVLPELEMGRQVAHSLVSQKVLDYLEISQDYGVIEIVTPNHWVGKSIMKSSLRRKYGITIMAIRAAKTEKVNFSPNADVVLNEGDILTVIGAKHDLDIISALK